jgi:L-lactate dehydrogenase
MDMNHGLFFVPPVVVQAGGYDDCRDAAVVVITAGAKQAPGQTRLELVRRNARIIRGILDEVLARTREAVIVMVTNPVDVLTHVAVRHAGLASGRVFGSGTVLDSARLRFALSRRFVVDPRSVHAYVVGEHGDSEIVLWSHAQIGGTSLKAFCASCGDPLAAVDREAIEKEVRDSAYHVIESKGATYYAVSLALERILATLLRDERSVLTVSAPVGGLYGLPDVCLSLPAVIGRGGVDRILKADLDPGEIEGLRRSADVLRRAIDEVEADGSA